MRAEPQPRAHCPFEQKGPSSLLQVKTQQEAAKCWPGRARPHSPPRWLPGPGRPASKPCDPNVCRVSRACLASTEAEREGGIAEPSAGREGSVSSNMRGAPGPGAAWAPPPQTLGTLTQDRVALGQGLGNWVSPRPVCKADGKAGVTAPALVTGLRIKDPVSSRRHCHVICTDGHAFCGRPCPPPSSGTPTAPVPSSGPRVGLCLSQRVPEQPFPVILDTRSPRSLWKTRRSEVGGGAAGPYAPMSAKSVTRSEQRTAASLLVPFTTKRCWAASAKPEMLLNRHWVRVPRSSAAYRGHGHRWWVLRQSGPRA